MATTISAATPARAPASRLERQHRLTIDEYYRMIEAGVFHEDDPIILWKGRLVETMTKGPDHANALTDLYRLMLLLLPAGWHIRQEQPMAIANDGMPEPDLTVVRGTTRDYRGRTPTAQDVALIVEVADSSLAEDQGEVLEAYAELGIPVYWIVNLPQRRIEVYTQPTGPGDPPFYRTIHYHGPDDVVPVVLDGREVGRIAVTDVLP